MVWNNGCIGSIFLQVGKEGRGTDSENVKITEGANDGGGSEEVIVKSGTDGTGIVEKFSVSFVYGWVRKMRSIRSILGEVRG